MITVSNLSYYPLKSAKGTSIEKAAVTFLGLEKDRVFMLCQPDGTMVTSRTHPILLQVEVTLLKETIRFRYNSLEDLIIRLDSFEHKQYKTAVWEDDFIAYSTNNEATKWFSELLEFPVRLLHMQHKSNRIGAKTHENLSFADAYPILLLGKSSLEKLNSYSTHKNTMAQFRPNIEFEGGDSFVEDTWKKIKIGEVFFEVKEACSRCVMTTFNPETSTKIPNAEPLLTLFKFRRGADKEVYFGQNIIPLNEGEIKVGDVVEVLETIQREHYPNAFEN